MFAAGPILLWRRGILVVMRYHNDKSGSKLLFFAIVVVFVYLAVFNFNIQAAYDFTVQGVQSALSPF